MKNTSVKSIISNKLPISKVKRSILAKWDWENPLNNQNVMVWGSIGIGKTWIICSVVAERMIQEREAAIKSAHISPERLETLQKELDRLYNYTDPEEIEDLLEQHMLVYRVAELSAEAITGLPAANLNEKCLDVLIPRALLEFSKQQKWVVVFFDELDKADKMIMTALTHLFENGMIGSYKLPKDSFVIAAANRIQDSAFSQEIVPELRNRMSHIELHPDVEEWVEWAQKKNVYPSLVSFIHLKHLNNQNFFTVYPENEQEYAFTTPRMLVSGAKLMQRLEKKGYTNEELCYEFAQLVGERTAQEYYMYLEHYSKVNILDILDRKVPYFKDLNNQTAQASQAQAQSAQAQPAQEKQQEPRKVSAPPVLGSPYFSLPQQQIRQQPPTTATTTALAGLVGQPGQPGLVGLPGQHVQEKRAAVKAVSISEQYIYVFAILDQLKTKHLQEKPDRMDVLLEIINVMQPGLRRVMISGLYNRNKDILDILDSQESGRAIFEIFLNTMKSKMTLGVK